MHSACAFQFLFGHLYKMYDLKRVFMTSIVIFLVGSVFCAAASTSKMFVLGRAISGLGGAGAISGSFIVLVGILPLHRRPLWTSILGSVESAAAISSPVIGGLITQRLGWRWCFWIDLPIGAVVLLTSAFCFSNPQQREPTGPMTLRARVKQLDLLGTVVFVPGITCLFIALSYAGTKYAWDSGFVIGLFVAFGVCFGLFITDQVYRKHAATFPPRIIKQRSVVAGFIFSMCCNSCMNVLEYYMPTYFQAVRGYSPAESGIMMLPVAIAFPIAVVMSGAATSMFGYYTPSMLLGSVLLPLAGGLMTTWKVDSTRTQMILYSGIAGFAGGIAFQSPQSAVQASLSDADGPMGLSIILFAQNFGPALFVSIAQTIFTNQLSTNLKDLAPGVNATSIENMGLGQLKATLGEGNMEKVLDGLDKSLVQTWYLVIALGCASMIGSVLMEWRSVKQKKT